MDKTVQKINVEEIMAEIRKEIEEKGYRDKDVLFTDIPLCTGTFEDNLGALHDSYNVNAYRHLGSKSPGVILKKIIRKLTKFYIEPIVDDQNENNRLIVACMHDLYFDLETMSRKVKSLEDEIKQLKENK